MTVSEPASSAATSFGTEPAAMVIDEVLRRQDGTPARGSIARLFGRSPLAAETVSWWRGAQGELAVAERLSLLGDDVTVLHSVPVGVRGSDIDHIVVGPAGVTVINTKHHASARVWVGASGVLVNGQRTDHLRNSRYEARRVQRMLSARFGFDVPVSAVIVIHGAQRLQVRQQPEGASVVSSDGLTRWLRRRRADLTIEQRFAVAAAMSDPRFLGVETVGHAGRDRQLAFRSLQSEVRAASRTRVAWALAASAAGAVMAVSASALALQGLTG